MAGPRVDVAVDYLLEPNDDDEEEEEVITDTESSEGENHKPLRLVRLLR